MSVCVYDSPALSLSLSSLCVYAWRDINNLSVNRKSNKPIKITPFDRLHCCCPCPASFSFLLSLLSLSLSLPLSHSPSSTCHYTSCVAVGIVLCPSPSPSQMSNGIAILMLEYTTRLCLHTCIWVCVGISVYVWESNWCTQRNDLAII